MILSLPAGFIILILFLWFSDMKINPSVSIAMPPGIENNAFDPSPSILPANVPVALPPPAILVTRPTIHQIFVFRFKKTNHRVHRI